MTEGADYIETGHCITGVVKNDKTWWMSGSNNGAFGNDSGDHGVNLAEMSGDFLE